MKFEDALGPAEPAFAGKPEPEKTFTLTEVLDLVDHAGTLVELWDKADIGEEASDALNLVINVAGSLFRAIADGREIPTVESAIEENYEASPERVASWLGGAEWEEPEEEELPQDVQFRAFYGVVPDGVEVV